MSDLDRLEKLAREATPGPWVVDSEREESDFGSYSVHGIKGVAPTRWYSDSDMAHTALEPLEYPDAEFIAAANPSVVLDLIAKLREVTESRNEWASRMMELASITAERDAYKARLDAVASLASQWDGTPDYQPTDYDRGRVDQRHEMTMQLLESLDGDPTG